MVTSIEFLNKNPAKPTVFLFLGIFYQAPELSEIVEGRSLKKPVP